MYDIRKKKCNPIVDFSKFTSNRKNIEWSSNFALQDYNHVFFVKLCSKFNYVGPKKYLGWSQIFFKG